ncbi:MAG: YCF48-related protein [Flavobacteriaceae bacterium]|nr:YCF48-related protein [Flavobacteriaceae bacterium]
MRVNNRFTSIILFLTSFFSIGQNTIEPLTSSLYDVAIWDDNYASIVGVNTLLSTHNQGDSWVRLPINLLNYANAISEVVTADNQTGVAIGMEGTILRTTDKGVSWTRIPSLTGNEKFYNIQFIDGIGYIVGRYRFGSSGYFTPILYKSTDLGENWEEVPSNITNFAGFNPSFRVYFITTNIGYLKTNNEIYKTIDGGITWQEDLITPSSLEIRSMQFIDENIGYAYANTTGNDLVHETTDGGSTWSPLNFTQYSKEFKVVGTKIYYGDNLGGGFGVKMAEVNGSNQQNIPINQQGHITDIEFINTNVGYVIGRTPSYFSTLGRFIFKTTDGGVSWAPVDNSSHLEKNSNNMTYLNKVLPNTYVRSDLNTGAGDSNFHIVHSYDNGASWNVTRTYNVGGKITYANNDFICHVRYFDPLNSGNGVIISESNDGGLTFIDGPITTDLSALNFYNWQQVSEDDIFFNYGSYFYYSNDQGLSWETLSAPNGITNFRTQFISSTLGYLYGENVSTGVPEIYKTSNGGQSWVLLFDISSHNYSWTGDTYDFSDPDRLIVIPQFPIGSVFLYNLNTSTLSSSTAPDYVHRVKSVNNMSFATMTNQEGVFYTDDNGANYTHLNFVADGTNSTVPPFFIEPDESMTFYDYRSITRVKAVSSHTPDFLVGPEIVDMGTTTSYFIPQDPFGEAEWELLSGGSLILDPSLEHFRASVVWTEPGLHTLRVRRRSDFGNSNYVDIQVMVNGDVDTTPPIVITQDITVSLDQNGVATIDAIDVDNGSTDNITPTNLLTYQLDIYSFFCANIGNNQVSLMVTDLSGNSASATANVTVEDNLAPTILTQNITVDLNGNSSVTIVPEDVDNGSNDNCLITSLILDEDTFTSVGDFVITLTATDNSNNEDSETAIVTVINSLGVLDHKRLELIITPNPTNGNVEVISNTPYDNVRVIDLTGRVVANFDYNSNYDLSNLVAGLYILVFELDSGSSTNKILVKK